MDKIITGQIYTAATRTASSSAIAEALYIKDGMIAAVGSKYEMIASAPDGTPIEEKSGIILPGCCEGHAHISSTIEKLNGVDFSGLKTPDKYVQAIQEYLNAHPDATVICGQGYVNGVFPDKEPHKKYLDAISTAIPMVFLSEDCHAFWVNSKAMELAGSANPTGWIRELEMNDFKEVLPNYTVDDYKEAILHYQSLVTPYGITMACEPLLSTRKEEDLILQAYTELAKEDKLYIHFRVSYFIFPEDDYRGIIKMIKDFQATKGSEYFDIIGIKLFLDGVVEGHTALLSEPYCDTPDDCGEAIWDQDTLNEIFYEATRENLQIHLHAVGDGALEQALIGLEYASSKVDITPLSHSITHLQIATDSQIARMKNLNVIAVLNPYWHTISQEYYYNLEIPYLGKERTEQEYKVNSFVQAGVTCTQGSDYPVTVPPNPWTGFANAINRKTKNSSFPVHNPKECAKREDVLDMLTINGAKQLFLDKEYGSLEAGKSADYLVLDQNILEISDEDLYDVKVQEYVVKGKKIF